MKPLAHKWCSRKGTQGCPSSIWNAFHYSECPGLSLLRLLLWSWHFTAFLGRQQEKELPHWILSAGLHRNLPWELLELLPRSPSGGNPYYPHLRPLTALSSDQAKETVRIWVFSSDLWQVEPCFLAFLTLNYSWLPESIWLWSRPVAKHCCVNAASEWPQSLSLGGDFKVQIPPILEDFGVERGQEPGVFLMWSLISYQSTPDRSWLLSREDAEKIPKWRNPAITRKE